MGKTSENVGKHWSMDLEWNGTGGFRKRQSRESIRVQKDVGKLWKTSETSECRIGKHWSMENIGKHRKWNGKTSETSECEIGMEI